MAYKKKVRARIAWSFLCWKGRKRSAD